jgi:hypothetical protein
VTLNELSNAWNDLRNAALGRGTTPQVPAPLAAKVGREWTAFRRWLAEQGVLEDIFASAVSQAWVQRYRVLLAQVRAAGAPVETDLALEQTPLELLKDAGAAALSFAEKLAWGLGALGALGLVFVVVTRRK